MKNLGTDPTIDAALVGLQLAVTPEELWQACNRLIRSAVSVHDTLIGLPSLGVVPVFLRTTIDIPDLMEHFARLSKVAPIADIVKKDPGALVVRMSDHFTPTEEYRVTHMDPIGWCHSMAMLFWESNDSFLGHLSAIRRKEHGDFTDADMVAWRELHPHVNAAVRRIFATERSSAARASMELSMQALPLPMTMVSWDLSVDFSNCSAREALSLWRHGNDGARALKPAGGLPPDIRAACEQLKEAWNEASRENTLDSLEPRVLLDHAEVPELSAEIRLVLPQGGRSLQPSFAIQLTLPPCVHHEVGRAMARLAQLTSAERRTARLAAAGHENADIARELGVSISTVRTHLRHVFEKLGITSRAKLAPLHAALEATARSERG